MARNAAALVFIFCGLYLASNGQRCLPNPGDVSSLVGHSHIVLEGRVQATLPSTFQSPDSELLDVIILVVTVFKGQLEVGTTERIVVGPFGDSGSLQTTCVGDVPSVGADLVLFLIVSEQKSEVLRHFRLTANPSVADSESRRTVEENAPPTIRDSHSTICDEIEYCFHGGTCSFMPAINRYSCLCTPEYQGDRCREKRILVDANSMRDDKWVSEYFFLITIGAAAVFLVLVAICIVLVIFVRCDRSFKAKDVEATPGISGIKYHNVSTEPETTGERVKVSSARSSVGVQTDPTNGQSPLRRYDVTDRYRSNGNGGKSLATSDDDARLHNPQKAPQDVLKPGSHCARTGVAPLKSTLDARLPPAFFQSRDLQNCCDGSRPESGVWISRHLSDEGSVLRGQRLDGMSAERNSDVVSIAL